MVQYWQSNAIFPYYNNSTSNLTTVSNVKANDYFYIELFTDSSNNVYQAFFEYYENANSNYYYQSIDVSSSYLFQAYSWQLNMVGNGGGSSVSFKSGAGTTDYTNVNSNGITWQGSAPSCVTNYSTTETSNMTYGTPSYANSNDYTQSFSY